MQEPFLYNTIIKQKNSSQSDKDFLVQLTQQYPYFIAPSFFLLKQMQPTEEAYNLQVAKTALLFNNPFWLNFKLKNLPLVENETATPTEIAPLQTALQNWAKNDTTPTTLSFEPMHLVDYFASQGIKLKEDAQPNDKLGIQLKSFTDWLKTMKKINSSADTSANANIADMVVQALAAKSNAEGDVVTEAMAEVLIQQGKADKAIAIYQKLSLLNPAKSAFFAAKIEQLKA